MTTAVTDVEGAIRDWLRQQPAITQQVANRVFFGVSGNVFPQIVVRLINQRMDTSDAALSDDLIQFDCWGPKPGTSNAKVIAKTVKNALIGVLWDIPCGTILAGNTRCLGVYNISSIWLPDPQSDQAVYRVSATIQAIQDSGSAEEIPTPVTAGWNLVFSETFNTLCNEGQFLSTYANWGAYPSDYRVTDDSGHYEPNNISVIDTADGDRVMNCALKPGAETTDGQPWSAAPYPKLPGQSDGSSLGKRLECRVRITNPASGWHAANLEWPDSENWPFDGEIDWMEFDFPDMIGAFLHRQGATESNDQIEFTTAHDPTQWHVIAFEWIAGESFKLFHNGIQIGATVTSRVPETRMHTVLQNESSGNPTQASAVQYDWLTISEVA